MHGTMDIKSDAAVDGQTDRHAENKKHFQNVLGKFSSNTECFVLLFSYFQITKITNFSKNSSILEAKVDTRRTYK
jgi:hypothetical protein